MQERVAHILSSASRLRAAGVQQTDVCCCRPPSPTTSAAFATAFSSFSSALLLNMSTSVFRQPIHRRKAKAASSSAIERELTQSFFTPPQGGPLRLGTPFEKRTVQN